MRILDKISRPGGRANEDLIAFADGRWVMLLDGSSGLTPDVLTPKLGGSFQSDAQWFVRAFADAFSAVEAEERSLPAAVERALAAVERQYADLAGPDASPDNEPSASCAILRTGEDAAELLLLGDATAILDGVELRDPAVSHLDGQAIDFALHLAAQLNCTVAQAMQEPALRAKLLENRRKRNRPALPDGYGVLAPRRGITGQGRCYTLTPWASGTPRQLLFLSDGLAAAYQSYGLADGPAAFLRLAAREGLTAALDRAREIEAADDSLCRFPRFKKSDDASGVLVEF